MAHAVSAFATAPPECLGPQKHEHHVWIKLSDDSQPVASQQPTTSEKVIQAAAYSLIAIGIIFLVASAGFFGAGAIAGAWTVIGFGETLFPLGIAALIGGAHLLTPPSKVNSKIAIPLGSLTASV